MSDFFAIYTSTDNEIMYKRECLYIYCIIFFFFIKKDASTNYSKYFE